MQKKPTIGVPENQIFFAATLDQLELPNTTQSVCPKQIYWGANAKCVPP